MNNQHDLIKEYRISNGMMKDEIKEKDMQILILSQEIKLND